MNGIPQPVLQDARWKKKNICALTLAVVLPIFFCGSLCVGAPTWLVYQWNRGTYYGYVTVDYPRMTYTQNVGDTMSFTGTHFQVSSMQFVREKDTTFLVVHVKIKKDTLFSPDVLGKLVVYTSPVFDASLHAFTGNEIDSVGGNASLPPRYVSSRIKDYDDDGFTPIKGTSLEGDILFQLPSPTVPFVLVFIPPQSSTQFAWNSKINDCKFLPIFHC